MEWWIVEILMVGGSGGYIIQYWYRSARQRIARKLEKLPRSNIADVQDGELVRIVGTVKELDHTVVAPISGQKCVYYHAVVDRKFGGKWRRLADQAHGIPFILDDGTAHVYIEATRAMLTTKHLRFYPAHRPSPLFDRFLISHGISLVIKDDLRVHEMRIDIGETFTVMGAGVHDIDPRAAHTEDYRADRKTRLWFRGGKKYPLVMSDDPTLR
jgi:hypothetical protein